MQPAAVSEIRTEDLEQLMMPASPPKSRGRHDSLPEYARYRDDGCDISESCLTCVPVEELAGRFGISRRTVFRVIGSSKLPARVRSAAYDTTPIPIRRELSTVQPRKEAHCA